VVIRHPRRKTIPRGVIAVSRDIHHAGQDDPRFIVRVLNLPTRYDGDEGFTVLMRAVYNYLRRNGGWDGKGRNGHHGLTVGTIARAIQQEIDVVHVACEKLEEAGIVVLKRSEPLPATTHPESLECYDLVKLCCEGDMLKYRVTTIDADLADYVNRACEGTGLSFRDAVNGLVERAILADQRAAGVPDFEDPRNEQCPQCSTCRGSRHVIVHGEEGAEVVTCPDCGAAHLDWVGTRYVDGVSGRNSSTPPIVNQLHRPRRQKHMGESSSTFGLVVHRGEKNGIETYHDLGQLVRAVAGLGHLFYFSLKGDGDFVEIVEQDEFGDGHPVLNWNREQGWHDPICSRDAYGDLASSLTIGEVLHRIGAEDARMGGWLSRLMVAIAMGIKVRDTALPGLFDRCNEEFHPDHRVWRHIECA